MPIRLLTLLFLPLLSLAVACQAHDNPQRRIISTNGHGEVKVKPDMAILNLSVRATHKSGKAAKQDVDNRVNNFLDVLDDIGIKREDVIASNLRVHPRYEHYSGNRQFKGYEASRNMSVTLHDMEKLTGIMDKALEQRLEGIDQIRYDHSDADQYRNQAHKLAIDNSKTKAAALAEAYEAELGPIVTITYHNNTPIYGGMKSEMADAAASPMMARQSRPGTYIADELVFRDNIQVTFDLIVSE